MPIPPSLKPANKIINVMDICCCGYDDFFLPTRGESGQTTLFEKETPYQYLRVVEDTGKGVRYLCNKDCDFIQGGIIISRPDALMLDCMRSAMVGLAYLDDPPQSILFIGMGIGAMPRYLAGRCPNVRMDIIEIDPDVTPVAKRFFHFVETPNTHIHINDGARFVKSSQEFYDVIFLDACFGPDIPEQLASTEFFQQTRARLKEKGILAINLASPVLNPQFNKLINTLCTFFPMMEILSVENPANVIVVAGKTPFPDRETIIQRARTIKADRNFDFNLEPLARERLIQKPVGRYPIRN